MSVPMARLENSRRTLDKVTYTPLVLPESADGGGALQVAGAAEHFRLLPGEAQAAAGAAGPTDAVRAVLMGFDALASAPTAEKRLLAAGQLARRPTKALTDAVALVRAARERALTDTINAVGGLTRAYIIAMRSRAREESSDPRAGAALQLRPYQLAGPLAEAQAAAYYAAERESAAAAPPRPDLSAATSVRRDVVRVSLGAAAIDSRAGGPADTGVPALVADRLGLEVARHALTAVTWAERHAPEMLAQMSAAPGPHVPEALRRDPGELLRQGLPFLIDQVQRTVAVAGHLTQRNLQPIGLLHLEQLVVTPLAVERGELVYTLPLAPHEKVTLAHKEWTLREEEYARFVQDYFENYSERGVAEKSDMAVSARSETEHTKTLSMTRPAVPGAATVATPVDTQATTEDVTRERQSQEQSRRETREITDRASSLAVRDQKISFTVTTVSGVEDFTARLYENTHPDKVMTIEYYRRMRKWENQLYRTGIRLTYDVVLPDPGRRLRARWLEVKAIDEQLAAPFEFAMPEWHFGSVGHWSMVSTAVSSAALVTSPWGLSELEAWVASLDALARSHGVVLPAPPGEITAVEEERAVTEAAVRHDAYAFSVAVTIPPGYRPTKFWAGGQVAPGGDGEVRIVGEFWNQPVTLPADGQWRTRQLTLPATTPSRLAVGFLAYRGAVGRVRVWADVEPTEDAWRRWYTTAVSMIRQAAYARYNEARDVLRQRQAALLGQLAAPDALALRRMEREQVMHLVLEWLFPDFAQTGQAYKDAAANKPGSWQPAMEYGEYVKWVHQAIDWDRALVLLYPYFWDNADHHPTKLYLDHPDGAHREFLRAGAARVILAITPGYEEEVVSLLDKGELGQLAASSRFRPIIDRVRAAHTYFAELLNREFPPPEGGETAGEPSVRPRGQLIGQWFDWTPTSAMEVDTRVKSVISEA